MNRKINTDRSIPSVPAWVVLICLLISLAGIADHDLWTPDEPREAAIALSMNRSRNMTIPELAGRPFVEKPPLYYIFASGALSLLGSFLGNTPALRLTSALWGLGALGMTWLLARRMMSRAQATLSMLILATMPGFIQVTHWILVDNALLFFIVASLWAFSEAYETGRPRFLPLAGLFAAGAFLSKGMIGPVVIALGWLGLVLPRSFSSDTSGVSKKRWIGLHLAALLFFAGPAVAWALHFRITGGAELWNEWFWTNHFGRFSGSSEHLGHVKGPFYYLERAPIMMLPWIMILAAGLLFKAGQRKLPGRPWPCLLSWGLGGFLLLSLSSTKREIYLVVLLPAFAMMTSLMLTRFISAGAGTRSREAAPPPPWLRNLLLAWTLITLSALAMAALAPCFAAPARAIAPESKAIEIIGGWRIMNFFGLAAIVLMAILMTRRNMPFLHRWFATTGMTYIMLIALLFPMIDRVKSYGPAFIRLAEGTANADGELAVWNPDETTLAGFYYYCDLVFPAVSCINELVSILNGTHERFEGVIVLSKNFPPADTVLPAWNVFQSEYMGPKRALRWIGPKPE